MFERHVGIGGQHKLNAYSSSPKELDTWIDAWVSIKKCNRERDPSKLETESIDCFVAEYLQSATKLGKSWFRTMCILLCHIRLASFAAVIGMKALSAWLMLNRIFQS